MGADIVGDGANQNGGNDLIIIQVGSTVGGNIDGDGAAIGGNDTIEFTNVDEAAAAIISACVNPANCDIVIGTKTYKVRNFETIRMVLLAIQEEFSGATLAITREFCTGRVKAFRLVNGDVEVYSGFDLLPPNGFLVGVIPNGQTGTFSNNDKGWSLTIGADGRIRVFDTAPNLVSDLCVR